METKYCPNHKEVELEYKEGDSLTKFKKDGTPKHWKGWKCQECGKIVEWVNDKPKTQNIRQNQGNIGQTNEQYANLMVAMRELYILVKAAALQTTTERDLNDTIVKLKESGVKK